MTGPWRGFFIVKPLLIIAGPTASGKSALALELARRYQGELLCFDSTTVYRGLDIGTAKPTLPEQACCPHHLLNLVEAGQEFSLAHFLKAAEKALAEVRGRGKLPILVGGTFLYLRAFLEGYQLSESRPDRAFRQEAEQRPLKELVEELLQFDPQATEVVDLANPRRVIRALEVCRSGHKFSQQYRRLPRQEAQIKVGLQAEADWLKQRIRSRCQAMLQSGWREEVARLRERGLESWLWSMRFVGYPEVLHGLEVGSSDLELEERVAESTWRLVKKQRTWGRSEPGVRWFRSEDPEILEQVCQWVTGSLGSASEKLEQTLQEITATGEPEVDRTETC